MTAAPRSALPKETAAEITAEYTAKATARAQDLYETQLRLLGANIQREQIDALANSPRFQSVFAQDRPRMERALATARESAEQTSWQALVESDLAEDPHATLERLRQKPQPGARADGFVPYRGLSQANRTRLTAQAEAAVETREMDLQGQLIEAYHAGITDFSQGAYQPLYARLSQPRQRQIDTLLSRGFASDPLAL